MRPFAVGVDGLEPERFGLFVRTINITPGAGRFSGAPSMDHHCVVPCCEPVRKVQRFVRADDGCD
ncbi:MAG TPA: hypothetical protein VGF24_15760 [Vicinamibacterales bacterium]|jgi:hypothetical protein